MWIDRGVLKQYHISRPYIPVNTSPCIYRTMDRSDRTVLASVTAHLICTDSIKSIESRMS